MAITWSRSPTAPASTDSPCSAPTAKNWCGLRIAMPRRRTRQISSSPIGRRKQLGYKTILYHSPKVHCHSEERSDEESGFLPATARTWIPRVARDDNFWSMVTLGNQRCRQALGQKFSAFRLSYWDLRPALHAV